MEPNARYFFVGSVVLVIISGLCFFALWMSGQTEAKFFRQYSIVFREQTLSGLQIGSRITMRGINVGSVTAINLVPDALDTSVTIRLDAHTPVDSDTRAIVERNILTGLATIELSSEDSGHATPLKTESGEEFPIIPEGTGKLAIITRSLTDVLKSLDIALIRISETLSAENQHSITSTLSSVKHLSESLAEDSNRFSEVMATFNSTLLEMEALVREARSHAQTTSEGLRSSTDSIARDSSSLTKNVTGAARHVTSTFSSFDNPRTLLSGPSTDTLGPGESLTGGE